jgi:hypothetical protein
MPKVTANGYAANRAKLMALTSPLGWLRMGAQSMSSGALMVQSGGVASGYGGGIANWIHLEAIQVLAYHASAVIVTLVLSAIVGYVIQRLMREGWVKRLVTLLDELLVAALVIFFVAELVLYFWQQKSAG